MKVYKIFLNIINKSKYKKVVLYKKNRNIVVIEKIDSKIKKKGKMIVKIGIIYYGGSDVASIWVNKKDMEELECLKKEDAGNFADTKYIPPSNSKSKYNKKNKK